MAYQSHWPERAKQRDGKMLDDSDQRNRAIIKSEERKIEFAILGTIYDYVKMVITRAYDETLTLLASVQVNKAY